METISLATVGGLRVVPTLTNAGVASMKRRKNQSKEKGDYFYIDAGENAGFMHRDILCQRMNIMLAARAAVMACQM